MNPIVQSYYRLEKHLAGRHDQKKHGRSIPEPASALAHRVSLTPEEFLQTPRLPGTDGGTVDTRAVLSYLLKTAGGRSKNSQIVDNLLATPDIKSTVKLREINTALNIGAHLAHVLLKKYPSISEGMTGSEVEKSLVRFLLDVKNAAIVTVDMKDGSGKDFVRAGDRQLELARIFLKNFNVLPAGEDPQTAENEFSAVSSQEEGKLLRKRKKIDELRIKKIDEWKAAQADYYYNQWGNEAEEEAKFKSPPQLTNEELAAIDAEEDRELDDAVARIYEGIGD